MGTTVSVGQAVGAGDRKQAAHNIGNTVILFLVVSIALTAHPVIPCSSHCRCHVYANGCGERYGHLFDHLLYRDSVYYILQHYQFYFSRVGRQQKPDVLYCHSLCCQHRFRLSFYGCAAPWACGRSPWYNSLSGNQCSCFPYRYFETQEHRSEKKRLQALPCGHGENFWGSASRLRFRTA